MEEVWKDIPDYEGLYQVSNLGRVKSLPRKSWPSKYGDGAQRTVPGKIRAASAHSKGATFGCISIKRGIGRSGTFMRWFLRLLSDRARTGWNAYIWMVTLRITM